MATSYDYKIKTSDDENKSTTKTFSGVTPMITDTTKARALGTTYTALTDYTTRTAQTYKIDDVDLDAG